MRAVLLSICVAVALATFLFASEAKAIPAFARRYETSCQTCHLVFPRLTPFGEAFRRNGYRFPEGGDVESEKEEPILLGAEAQKDVWPNAVYPGQLPRWVPLSLMLEGTVAIGPHIEGGHEMPGGEAMAGMPAAAPEEHRSELKFTDIGGKARLLSGGTFGSIGSFFAAISFGYESPAEVERGNVQITPIDQTSLMLKVGKFEPALHGVSIHRGVMGHQLRLTTTMVGLDGFMPEHALKGFEASGLIFGRVGWNVGAVENSVPVVGYTKDFYGRLEAKIGGMRLDGVGAVASSAAWRERSFLVGASVYRGKATVSDTISMPGMTMTHDDTFVRMGADAHAVLDDLLIDLVVVQQRHDAPSEVLGQKWTMNLVYAEATYVTWPWLFPTVRFEYSQIKRDITEHPRWIGMLGINALIRANLTLRGEGAMGADPGDKTGFRYAALTVSAAF